MAIILLIKTEDGQVTELPLLNKVILGRSGDSDYKIADVKMSGSHGSFEINGKGQILYTDLGSTNGSFLNNSQMMRTIFRINDILKLGNTIIKLDEIRLSSTERLAIGLSTPVKKQDKTLPELSIHNSTGLHTNPGPETLPEPPKKKTIILSQQHKEKKKAGSNWSGNENLIDQEASSGNTKFLKLTNLKSDKKKK